MYRFICMLTAKKYACTIVLFFTPCKSKNPMLWSCSCTQDVFGYYANCYVKMVKKYGEKKMFPPNLKNKH